MTTNLASSRALTTPSVFVGRQPILDREQRVFGYELLFRSSLENNFSAPRNGDHATCQTINNSLNVMGLNHVAAGHKIFVNITRQLLLKDLYTVLPAPVTVIELLESVTPDAPVIQACRRLKAAGYGLALDDFVFRPGYEPLLDVADFVKIDFLQASNAQRAAAVDLGSNRNICLVAEKVETKQDFAEGLGLGYDLFQGYFFAKPEILTAQELQPFKRNYLRFLQQAVRPKPDFGLLERIIKEEPSLSVKLLRYMNASTFGMRAKINSIKQALALLGERQLRQWASILAMTSLGDDKPAELVTLCLIRARFCEELCPLVELPGRELDLFLLGLLSALDSLVDRPLSEVLSEIPVAQEVRAALLGGASTFGTIYGLVLACERNNPRLVSLLATKINLPADRVMQMYCDAMLWADNVLHS